MLLAAVGSVVHGCVDLGYVWCTGVNPGGILIEENEKHNYESLNKRNLIERNKLIKVIERNKLLEN